MLTGGRWRLPEGAAVPLVLLAAFAAAFAPVLFGQRSFYHYDLYTEHVPVWHAVQAALRAGESPFWLDGMYAGHPLLYHQEAPLFYPLTIPLLLTGVPPWRLADAFSLIHFLLAGFLAARLVKEETGDEGAAALGGVAWMLSTRTLHCALWPNAVAVAALAPGLLLGLLRIGRGEQRSGVVLAASFGGLLGLAARPQAVVGFLPAILACALLALFRARRRGAALRDLALSLLVAAALAAPSVAPTALLHPEMERAGGLSRDDRDLAALTTSSLGSLLLPAERGTLVPETESHPGFAVWALLGAALVLRSRSRDLLGALGIAGACGIVFAFGDAGPYRLLSGLPLLDSLRAPSRYLLSWSLFLALGAALGAAALARRFPARRGLVPIALLLLGADLVLHVRKAAPTVPVECWEVVPRVARLLEARDPDASGFPRRHWTVARMLPDLSDSAAPCEELENSSRLPGGLGLRLGLESLEGGGPALARTRQLLDEGFPHAAPLAGVDAVVSFEALYRVPDPLPRAYVVPDAIIVPREAALRVLLSPAFDAKRTVILEPGAGAAAGDWVPADGSARLLDRRGGRLRLEADLPGPGFLVLLDAFERGWTARVDGVAAPVLPANSAFRAVPLPAGRHIVEMTHEVRGVGPGLALAALGVVLLVLRFRTREAPDRIPA